MTVAAIWSWFQTSVVGKWLMAGAGILATYGLITLQAFNRGKAAQQQNDQTKEITDAKTRNDVEQNIAATPDDAVRDKLQKWDSQ